MLYVLGRRIRISQGDNLMIRIRLKSETDFTEADKAVFTVRRRGGGAVLERVVLPIAENGDVILALDNEITRKWRPGPYEWDLRIAFNAVGEDVSGAETVFTPMRPAAFEVMKGVGTI